MNIDDVNQKKTDLIEILSAEYTIRCRRNPRYSLRAFAKSLGLSHTILSLVFSGKRKLSKGSAIKIANALSLDVDFWIQQYDRNNLGYSGLNYNFALMELEKIEMIADWIPYAILSLLEIDTEDYQDLVAPKSLAKRLGINETQAKLYFNKLVELNLIQQDQTGRWRQTGNSIKVENKVSTEYTRKFHKQLLTKALDSLENDPIEVRDFSSMTFAIDPQYMAYAQERIRRFRRELVSELEAKGKPQVVYNLAVQIYPVSK